MKVKDHEPNALVLQLSMPKVECQEFSSTFCTIFFLFYVDLIDSRFFLHSFSLILLVNAFVFQVFFNKKVNLMLIDVPFNLLILHIFEPLSLILPWKKRVDNFIKSIVVFIDRFLFDRKVFIIMHVDDL